MEILQWAHLSSPMTAKFTFYIQEVLCRSEIPAPSPTLDNSNGWAQDSCLPTWPNIEGWPFSAFPLSPAAINLHLCARDKKVYFPSMIGLSLVFSRCVGLSLCFSHSRGHSLSPGLQNQQRFSLNSLSIILISTPTETCEKIPWVGVKSTSICGL